MQQPTLAGAALKALSLRQRSGEGKMGMTRVSNLKVRAALLVVGLLVTLVVLALGACGGVGGGEGGEAAGAEGKLARVVEIEGERGLYVRCTGSGSPTVVMEAGDENDSSLYINVEYAVAQKTRTCVYDRAGLGKSDPAPPPPAPAAGSGRGPR
jgi:hypothetical protein